MSRDHQKISKNGIIITLLILLNAIVLEQGLISNEKWYWALIITIPALFIFFLRK